jgi:hypothetical protein
MTIKEHDCVVLSQDVPGAGLEAGDIGTVVHVHPGGSGYEVEFMMLAGRTLTVATLRQEQLLAIQPHDVVRVRELAPSGS